MTKLMLLATALLVACADTSETRLDHAQILAVRAEPANIAPGQRARIDILAGDSAGNVYEAVPDTLFARGNQPLATEHTPEGWFVTAGDAPEVVTLAVTLAIDGTEWPATKKLVVAEPADNPRVDMQIDGAFATEMIATAGTKPQLSALPQGREPFTYAWYSSVGDISKYRQPEAELDAKDPASGHIVLVVRDAMGGVAWSIHPARVE